VLSTNPLISIALFTKSSLQCLFRAKQTTNKVLLSFSRIQRETNSRPDLSPDSIFPSHPSLPNELICSVGPVSLELAAQIPVITRPESYIHFAIWGRRTGHFYVRLGQDGGGLNFCGITFSDEYIFHEMHSQCLPTPRSIFFSSSAGHRSPGKAKFFMTGDLRFYRI